MRSDRLEDGPRLQRHSQRRAPRLENPSFRVLEWCEIRMSFHSGAYLNSGRASSDFFVASGRTTRRLLICKSVNGTATRCLPMPRKPPTDRIAYVLRSALGETIR